MTYTHAEVRAAIASTTDARLAAMLKYMADMIWGEE